MVKIEADLIATLRAEGASLKRTFHVALHVAWTSRRLWGIVGNAGKSTLRHEQQKAGGRLGPPEPSKPLISLW